jgi:uncharacterized protein YndB with AHSA1/START domain
MDGETPLRMPITRRFAASPERVFDARLDPEMARTWLFGSLDSDPDQRVETHARAVGAHREIDRPRRLALTFAIPAFAPDVGRIVVEILPDGAGCRPALTHEQVPLEFQDAATHGWSRMFDDLDALLLETTSTLGTRA